MIDPSELFVRVFVPEPRMSQVKVGQEVYVTTGSSTEPFHGTVAFVSDQAEFTPNNIDTPEQRTKLVFAVRIAIDDASGALKSGMPVDVLRCHEHHRPGRRRHRGHRPVPKLRADRGRRRVDLEVAAGAVFGLLGPDGAGKSTLIRMLATVLRPDSGEAWVQGHSVTRAAGRVTPRIGYMSQKFALYPDLTVQENIEFFAKLRGVRRPIRRDRCCSCSKSMGLAEFLDRQAGRSPAA